ncbi:MAG: 7,8-didemethyl-8-hydroxy-5-deazariboflavin synthase subunit CofG [Promethearchaeota archaeon]
MNDLDLVHLLEESTDILSIVSSIELEGMDTSDDSFFDNKVKKELFKKSSSIARWRDNWQITYSKNIFVPVSRVCVNDCTYCNFKKRGVALAAADVLFSKKYVISLLRQARAFKCREVLLCGGEKSDLSSSVRRAIISNGIKSGRLVDWLLDLSDLILKSGLLPHTNVGVLKFKDLAKLKPVNASLGLMLENASNRFMDTGMPHEKSPGKDPLKRLKMIKDAGQLQIPFTTGILVGIGETLSEVIQSLYVIKVLHEEFGHIQEVIIQPLDGGLRGVNPRISMKDGVIAPANHARWRSMGFLDYLMIVVALARILIPADVAIQVPPNILGFDGVLGLLRIGASDLGGISPVTPDHINPRSRWPNIQELKAMLAENGFDLVERLPIYEKFLTSGSSGFVSTRIRSVVKRIGHLG